MDQQGSQGIQFAEPPEGLLTAPENRVIAHMDDPESLTAAVHELAEAGFNRDEIHVLCGQKGAERLDASGRQHGLTGRIYRLLEWAIDAHEVLLESETPKQRWPGRLRAHRRGADRRRVPHSAPARRALHPPLWESDLQAARSVTPAGVTANLHLEAGQRGWRCSTRRLALDIDLS